jgi:hypothetical protein
MRPTPLIALGLALAAGQALAASQGAAGTSKMPATDAPMQSAAPSGATSTAPTAPGTTAQTPSTSATTSASGSGSDTSATAGASASAAPPSLSVGEPVKDNTGATIGSISALSNGANGQKMAVIKMGNDTFQVPSDRLGADSNSATINMTQAQITGMLHPAAGGR